jgi:hypothetical protein
MNWDDLVTFAQEFSDIAGGQCTSKISREDFMYADETGIALITSATYSVHLPTFLEKTLWPYAQESIRGQALSVVVPQRDEETEIICFSFPSPLLC